MTAEGVGLRKLWIGLVLCLVALVAWLALPDPADVAQEPDTQERTDDRTRPERTRHRSRHEGSSSVGTSPRGSRREPISVAEEDSGGTLDVRDATTRKPVGGANVYFVPFGPQDQIPWTPESLTDPIDVAARMGQRFRTDAKGEVRLPRFEHYAFIASTQGDLSGYGTLPTGYRLWGLSVRKTVTVRVRVVDPTGQSVPGVPVGHFVQTSSGSRLVVGATTESRGTASFRVRHPKGAKSRIDEVGFVSLGASSVRVPFDSAAPPGEPLVLELPASASLEMTVQSRDGSPPPAQMVVRLVAHAFQNEGDAPVRLASETREAAVENGRVVMDEPPFGSGGS